MGDGRGDTARTADEGALVAGIAVVVALAPAAIGGALPWTQVVTSALCLVLFGAAARRAPVGLPPLSSLFAVAAAAAALQLVPLPAELLGALSPAAAAARADAAPLALAPLTLDVPATLLALARSLGGFGLFLVAARVAAASWTGERALLVALSATAGAIGLVGLLQMAARAQAILGFYRPSIPTPFMGTFVDPNHAAELLGLGLCVGIGLAGGRRYRPGATRQLGAACAVVCLGALLATRSRGGITTHGAIGAALFALLLVRRLGRARGLAVALGSAALVAALAATSLPDTVARFRQLDSHTVLHNQKVDGWRDALRLVGDYPLAGVGRGAFAAPLQRYRRASDGTSLAYPENLVVQSAAESGLPVTLALLALAAAAAFRHRAALRRLDFTGLALLGGVAGVLVQNLVDFGLELPGVALPFSVALGVLVADVLRIDGASPRAVPRRAALVAVVVWGSVLAVATWALPRTLDADDARLFALARAPIAAGAAAPSDRDDFARAADEAIARHPADYHLETLAAIGCLRRSAPCAAHHVNRALRLNPVDRQPHRLAAILLARAGHPSQAAVEYRTYLESANIIETPTLDEMLALLGAAAVDGVPQQPDWLFALAARAAAATPRRAAVAEAATARARALAPPPRDAAPHPPSPATPSPTPTP